MTLFLEVLVYFLKILSSFVMLLVICIQINKWVIRNRNKVNVLEAGDLIIFIFSILITVCFWL